MFIVKCRECGDEHDTTKVQFVNVEEDFQGRDVFTFVCPVTSTSTNSLVFGRPDSCAYDD